MTRNVVTLVGIAFFFSAPLFAQDSLSCYQKWDRAFEARGSNPVDDGDHNNVVVSIRKKIVDEENPSIYEYQTNCYSGKVSVKDGNVVEIYIRVMDNSYEKLDKELKYFNLKGVITNGMTRNIVTQEGDLINVIFHEKLKERGIQQEVANVEIEESKEEKQPR